MATDPVPLFCNLARISIPFTAESLILRIVCEWSRQLCYCYCVQLFSGCSRSPKKITPQVTTSKGPVSALNEKEASVAPYERMQYEAAPLLSHEKDTERGAIPDSAWRGSSLHKRSKQLGIWYPRCLDSFWSALRLAGCGIQLSSTYGSFYLPVLPPSSLPLSPLPLDPYTLTPHTIILSVLHIFCFTLILPLL